MLVFRAGAVQLEWDSSYRPMLAEEVNQLSGAAVAPDGKVYVSGAFDYVNGIGKQQVVRLNADGTVDPTFTLRTTESGQITPWLVRPDGKVLVKVQQRLRWMNPNGMMDVAPRIYASEWQFSGSLNRGELLADGSVLVSGNFGVIGELGGATGTEPVRNFPGYGLARLTRNGSLDLTYQPPEILEEVYGAVPDGSVWSWIFAEGKEQIGRLDPNGVFVGGFPAPRTDNLSFFHSIAVQQDGKIWLGGRYFNAGGYTNLVRFNPDGTVDSSIEQLPQVLAARWLHLLPDGSVLVHATFSNPTRHGLARVKVDGSVDKEYPLRMPVLGLHKVANAPDGSYFILYLPNGTESGLVRMTADHKIDTSFNPKFYRTPEIRSLIPDGQGRALLTTFMAHEVPEKLSRINADGSLDEVFKPQLDIAGGENESPFETVVLPDGKLLTGVSYSVDGRSQETIVRLQPSGTRDPSFSYGVGQPPGWISAITAARDGKMYVGLMGQAGFQGEPPSKNILARYHANGAIDGTFTNAFQFRSKVDGIFELDDSAVIVTGLLYPLGENELRVIARIRANGEYDWEFDRAVASLAKFPVLGMHRNSQGGLFFAAASNQGEPVGFGREQPIFMRLGREGDLIDSVMPSDPGAWGSVLMLDSGDKPIIGNGQGLARFYADGSRDASFGTGPFFEGGNIRRVSHMFKDANGSYVLGGNFVVGPAQEARNLIRVHETSARIRPSLNGIGIRNGRPVFAVGTNAGEFYSIVRAGEMTPCGEALWETVTTFIGNGGEMEIEPPNSTNGSASFYRLAAP